MKKAAIQKARKRIERAKTALSRIEKSDDFASFSDAWTDFLLASNSVFSILEKGAKTDATSRQWYHGKKKRDRKDPLIRYMVQARNADEHGIEPVAEHVPGYLTIGRTGETVCMEGVSIQNGQLTGRILPVDGKLPTVEIHNPHPKLVAVFDDRFGGEWYQPPYEHLGSKLPDSAPLTIARLLMKYVSNLVDEAESYIHQQST